MHSLYLHSSFVFDTVHAQAVFVFIIAFALSCFLHSLFFTQKLMILLSEYTPTRQRRSSNTRLLQQPRSSLDIAWCAFSRAAPTVRNNLLTDIGFANLFMNVRSLLRAHFTDLLLIVLVACPPGPAIHHIMLTYWPVNKNTIGLLTVFKPKPKPRFSAKTEENRNRNFSWA